MILAIDPGPTESGYAVFNLGRVLASGVRPNAEILTMLQGTLTQATADTLAIEMIASYGMAVGAPVFETVRWIGRFQQAWHDPEAVRLVFRKDVKHRLCGNIKAKGTNVRQALIDLLGEPGTRAKPGPTFGVKSHAWSAVAVAVTVAAQMNELGDVAPVELVRKAEPLRLGSNAEFFA